MSTLTAEEAPKKRKIHSARATGISSPEQMHDSMRVTTPWLWILLSTIIVLLLALVIFAANFTMENTLAVQASLVNISDLEEGTVPFITCKLPPGARDLVNRGMTVRVAGVEGVIEMIVEDAEDLVAYVQIDPDTRPLKDGSYDAEIVLESTTPIRFLIN